MSCLIGYRPPGGGNGAVNPDEPIEGFTPSRVLFVGADGSPEEDSGFTFNSTTNVLTAAGGMVVGDLTAGRVLVAGASGRLVDDSGLTFDTGTNILTALGGVVAGDLTSGRVAIVGASGRLADDSGLTYNPTTDVLTVAGGVVVSDLTAGRVALVGTSGRLVDDSGLTFNTSTNALTATGQFLGADGSASAPEYSFTSNADCGFYIGGSVIGISCDNNTAGVTIGLPTINEGLGTTGWTRVALTGSGYLRSSNSENLALMGGRSASSTVAEVYILSNGAKTAHGLMFAVCNDNAATKVFTVNADGACGFWGATAPTSRTTWTQTYSTAATTVTSPPTDSTGGTPAASLVDVTTTTLADPVKCNANFATVSDHLDLVTNLINGIIDALQLTGYSA